MQEIAAVLSTSAPARHASRWEVPRLLARLASARGERAQAWALLQDASRALNATRVTFFPADATQVATTARAQERGDGSFVEKHRDVYRDLARAAMQRKEPGTALLAIESARARYRAGEPTAEQIAASRAQIPAAHAVVVHFDTGRGVILLVADSSGVSGQLHDSSALVAKARSWPRLLLTPGVRSQTVERLLVQWHQSWIAPLEPHLAGKSHLVMIPYGSLRAVPFDALHDGQSYVIEKYTTAHRRRFIGRCAPSEAPSHISLLALLDPVTEDTATHGNHYPRLQHAAAGVEALLRAESVREDPPGTSVTPGGGAESDSSKSPHSSTDVPNRTPEFCRRTVDKTSTGTPWDGEYAKTTAKIYSAVEASEAVLSGLPKTNESDVAKDNSDVCSLLHLACHGEFSSRHPWESALLLAQGKTDDGRLTAHEFRKLQLQRFDLVCLSGCETGLAATDRGDDLAGFARALQESGAHRFIGSLCKVSDEAAGTFMARFYRHFIAGHDAASALRCAKLESIANHRGRPIREPLAVDSPLHWGAWTLFENEVGRAN